MIGICFLDVFDHFFYVFGEILDEGGGGVV